MNKKALFCLVLFIASFFTSLFLNFHKIKNPYFGALYKEIKTDIIFKNEAPSVFYDGRQIKNYIKVDKNHYLFIPHRFDSVKKIHFQNAKNIEKLMFYVDKKVQFVDEIKDEIEINNDKTLFDKMQISFLSFFYSPSIYIVSYIFLFLFFYNFQFKNKNTKYITFSLILISILTRMTQFKDLPFWDDEIYVLSHTINWLDTFKDPGNPPLYFILFKIWRDVFNNPDFYRISSIIIGVIFNICFYFYLKAILNKKSAIIGLGICSINIVLIYLSQELRCYALLALLAIINSYYLFKFKNKTKWGYLISALLALYTHFYAAFYIFYNFICGLVLFFKNKAKLKPFILMNLIAFLAYVPLIIYKKTSITSDFNSWIVPPVLNSYFQVDAALFGNLFATAFIIVALVVLYKKSTKKGKLFIKYHSFAIVCVILMAAIFSYLIKPIFTARYFQIVLPCSIALLIYIISFPYKNKAIQILIFAIILMFNFRLDYRSDFCNHNIFLDFVKHDIDKSKINYVFVTDTIEGYKDFEIDGANMKYLQVNKGFQLVDIKEHGIKKPAIVYVSNLYLSDDTLAQAKKIELYKSPLGLFCKIVL